VRPRPLRRTAHSRGLEPCHTMRDVVRYATGDPLEQPVQMSGIARQLRSVPVNLIRIGAIGHNPAVARATADVSTERFERTISASLRAGGTTGGVSFTAEPFALGPVLVVGSTTIATVGARPST
jgi:hypothetical protein